MLDTNVAWRRIQKTDPHHANVKSAIDALVIAGGQVCITAQNLIEFRAVATRPMSANGLGLTSADAIIAASEIESLFDLLPETPDIYLQWRALVEKYVAPGSPR
jgi:predicted nucleic acid-binding protein